jgi:hypothetical protein
MQCIAGPTLPKSWYSWQRVATPTISISTTTMVNGIGTFFCSKHLLEYAEFLYYLKMYKYQDYLTSDTSPTRFDIIKTFEANARISNKLSDLLDEAERKGLGKLVGGKDYLETWQFIEENIFRLT